MVEEAVAAVTDDIDSRVVAAAAAGIIADNATTTRNAKKIALNGIGEEEELGSDDEIILCDGTVGRVGDAEILRGWALDALRARGSAKEGQK